MLRESLAWDGGKILTAHEATATVAKMMAAAAPRPTFKRLTDLSGTLDEEEARRAT